jgi:hypothetical protein
MRITWATILWLIERQHKLLVTITQILFCYVYNVVAYKWKVMVKSCLSVLYLLIMFFCTFLKVIPIVWFLLYSTHNFYLHYHFAFNNTCNCTPDRMSVTTRQSYLPALPSDYATISGELLRSFQNITGYNRTFHGHVINRAPTPSPSRRHPRKATCTTGTNFWTIVCFPS